jgi:DNA-binding transcriptional ArsR family regulator
MAKYKTITGTTLADFLCSPQCTANIRLFARLAYALSDESRLRALLALRGGEQCVCIITAILKLAPSTVSRHMSILREAGLVTARKQGKWIYFRLPDTGQCAVSAETLKLLYLCTKGDPRIAADLKVRKALTGAPRGKGRITS